MHTGEECSHKKKDKSEPSSESDTPKKDKKQESEDPKPRIVLTFRSDKSGAKSSNMKIVSTEEKHEDVTPRRSNRARKSTWESDDDIAISPKKDKTEPQQVSENDEALDGTQTAKRSKRRCNKVGTEPITNAIARREQLCKETAAPAPRLFRRIKPTPKILENEELRIGLESQNNVRLGITPEKSIDGVRTRRSAHNKSVDNQSESISPESKTQDESKGGSSKNSMKKLKHLCELGLKSVAPEKSDEDYVNRDDQGNYEDKEEEDEEIDDDTEVISKLLQEDSSSEPESGGSEMEPIKKKLRRNIDYESEESDDEPKTPPRRSQRLNHHSTYAEKWTDYYSDASDFEYKPEPKSKKRRTLSDKTSNANSAIEEEPEEKNAPADADEGSAPASPAESNRIVGQCCCENTSNIFAAPTELPEPVFCQAIESVEDMRVGCSHPAARDERGDLLPMVRCGPRSPYLLACRLHAAQLAKHMCCPLCGLFCTQGEFYQCSEGHLFHLDCALPREMTDPRHRTGCPHCGVWSYCWVPANTACHRVRVTMRAAARPVYLPDQREQSTTAFLGFTKLDPTKLDQGPLIPEDLLPPLPVDIKKMCEQSAEGGEKSVQQLYDAIVAGETLEQIIPKIVGVRVNDVPSAGEMCAHAAAAGGRADVLYALYCAGADLDVADRTARTPLMRAILALLENEPVEEPEEPSDEVPGEKVKEGEDKGKEDDKLKTEEAEDKVDAREHELMNVIKFLVAAGCDVDIAGPEGMSALHVAAAHGGAAACSLLLGAGAAVDARDHGGWTPLVRAAENGHAACVKVLLDAGADAGVTDGEGHGALHWCALAGRASCLRLLLAAAPHLAAAPNAHADTPLHVAAREGHYACVIILLAHGARTDMENSAGELPVEVCGGRCQAAISLNMQVALAARGKLARNRMLSSDISNGREPWPVECANEVDDAPLPADFTYTSQLVTPAPLHVDCTLATMQGCACVDGACDGGACACAALGVRSWYVRGRLPANFPYHDPPMLFECNHTCACNMKRCGNRVVSRLAAAGSIGARVQVFRTARRGWGLRARAGIRRGAPVALYTGELLARRDADARANDQYMFALDLKQDLLQQGEGAAESGAEDEALCVDAARWGGAARFINHSCEPNVAPVRVYTHTRDLRLPAVALFALRDIPAMEELTFDYGDKFWSVKSKWMKCECESPDCRYPNKAKEDNA